MSSGYVFDTEAIIALLYGEAGHEYVASLLADVDSGDAVGYLSESNASEIYYLVARFEGTDEEEPTAASLRDADTDIRTLARRGVSIRRADWQLAGEIKAHGDISPADACAVALAHETGATLLVGGDDDFDTLPVDIDIKRFRDHGV